MVVTQSLPGGWATCVNPDAPGWADNGAGGGVRGKSCVADIEEIAGVRDGRGDCVLSRPIGMLWLGSPAGEKLSGL